MSASISYAQNGEDVVLRRVFADDHRGLYIDVGAAHPVEDSVTKFFYDRGWRGINVEPGKYFPLLRAQRAEDRNLNVCLSNVEGELSFFEFQAAPALSTLSRPQARFHETAGWASTQRVVEVTTLARVCERYVSDTIDFVSIDVEGHEREVLEGADWTRWRPRVLIVEATRPCTTLSTHGEWEHILLSADYLFALFDGLNRFYVRAEDRHLLPVLSAPANVFDECIPYKFVKQIDTLQNTIDQLRDDSDRNVRALRNLIADRNRQAARSRQRYEDIIISLQEKLAELHTALDRLGGLGPLSVAVAHTVHGYAMRMPRISAAVKKIVAGRKSPTSV